MYSKRKKNPTKLHFSTWLILVPGQQASRRLRKCHKEITGPHVIDHSSYSDFLTLLYLPLGSSSCFNPWTYYCFCLRQFTSFLHSVIQFTAHLCKHKIKISLVKPGALAGFSLWSVNTLGPFEAFPDHFTPRFIVFPQIWRLNFIATLDSCLLECFLPGHISSSLLSLSALCLFKEILFMLSL